MGHQLLPFFHFVFAAPVVAVLDGVEHLTRTST